MAVRRSLRSAATGDGTSSSPAPAPARHTPSAIAVRRSPASCRIEDKCIVQPLEDERQRIGADERLQRLRHCRERIKDRRQEEQQVEHRTQDLLDVADDQLDRRQRERQPERGHEQRRRRR